MDDFVLWLKDTRENMRISAKYLSEKIGKSHSYIHSLEKGLVKEIPDEVKQNILEALGFEEVEPYNWGLQRSKESSKRELCIREIYNYLLKMKTSELEGLVDIIRKRPDLFWTFSTIMEESDRTEIIYESLSSYTRFLMHLHRKV